jgi:hypothetical protein
VSSSSDSCFPFSFTLHIISFALISHGQRYHVSHSHKEYIKLLFCVLIFTLLKRLISTRPVGAQNCWDVPPDELSTGRRGAPSAGLISLLSRGCRVLKTDNHVLQHAKQQLNGAEQSRPVL